MSNKYFLPIKSINLAHYFQKVIICPANYLNNRNEDIQTKFDNNLLLSTSKFTENTDCTLEIVFDNQEEKPRQISENFYLFDMPLPISRIKAIIFDNNQQKTNTIFDIESGTAFLPKKLLIVETEINKVSLRELDDKKTTQKSLDWNSYLDKYDRVLGGLSVLSIAKKSPLNYTENYFNVLSIFNQLIKEQSSKIKSANDQNYSWAFMENGKYRKLYNIIYSDINNQILEEIAQNDNVKLETRNGLYQIDKIPTNKSTYLAAILASYGKNNRKKIDSFISDFQTEKFENSRKEGLALIFGINKGYSAFRNEYKTANFREELKFKLNSQLDYYIIESIYQFVFNQKTNNTIFQYIDSWCPKYQNKVNSKLDIVRVLDKDIIVGQKKTGFQGLFQDFLDKSSENRNRIYATISNEISKWLPPFAKPDIESSNNYFEQKISTELEKFAKSIFDETTNIYKKDKELVEELKLELNEKDAIIEKLNIEIESLKNQNNSSDVRYRKQTPQSPNISLFKEQFFSKKEKRLGELDRFNKRELQQLAKELEMKSYSRLNKKTLIEKIINTEFNNN